MNITSDDSEELEEERRLCYVGITRAQKKLTLTCANRRMVRGEMHFFRPSRFVGEIPIELLEFSGLHFEFPKERKEGGRVRGGESVVNQPIGKVRSQAFAYKKEPRQFTVDSSKTLSYQEGDRVFHSKLGEGEVLDITQGGRDYEVTVNFDNNGIKKMFSSFAKLEKI